MPFVIYPDTATSTALGKPDRTPIRLAPGEAMSAFVPVADLVGPDLSGDDQPTLFLRIAVSGPPVPANAQPTVELVAHAPDPGPAAKVDPKAATSQQTAVPLLDANGARVAAARFDAQSPNNIYLLRVAIERPGTRLSLRLTNTTGAERHLVWVAADNPAETLQPWFHASHGGSAPIDIAFELERDGPAGDDNILLTNFGTGGVTVVDVSPPVPAPFFLDDLRQTLGPNDTDVFVTLRMETSAPAEVPPTVITFVTANKVDAGPFGKGHNNSFTISGSVVIPSPRLRLPQEFSPKRGVPPDFEDAICRVTLFGENFDADGLAVFFGEVEAEILARSDTELTVGVPFMDADDVPLTVSTANGSVKSVDLFKVVPHPEITDLDPFVFGDHGKSPEGEIFSIVGTNFAIEPGDTFSVHAGLSAIDQMGSSVPIEVLSVGPSRIQVQAGAAPDFFDYIGGHVTIHVSRNDGGATAMEFEIEGL